MRRFATFHAALLLAALVPALAAPRAVAATPATAAAIEQAVQGLHRSGRLEVRGITLENSALLEAFYRRRDFAPAWPDRSGVDELAAAVADSELGGLVPADYRLRAILARRADPAGTAAEAAADDLLLTDSLVRLAEDIRYGKVVARRHDRRSLPALRSGDAAADLAQAIDEGRIRELLAGLEPRSAFYARLKDALANYRRIAAAGGWPALPAGPSLKPGATDTRMPLLRERLVATGDLASGESGGDRYDEALVAGVRTFQARHGLDADGVLGKETIAAMNVTARARIDQIRATLERCRQYLRDLPRRFVMVNVAGYRVLFLEDGQVVWRSRVIVGKPYMRTPMFRADMKSVILNPTWTIPASIVRNETMPAARRNPSYLAKHHIHRVGDDWVQSAGPDNALGRIKLNLPNPYSVYLHDTPTKSLFERTTRAFSHGCVRVDRPVELAALALDDPAWSVEALRAAIDTGVTREIRLAKPVPVMVMYWSVTASREGSVEFLPDVYRRDAPLLAVLDGGGPAAKAAAR